MSSPRWSSEDLKKHLERKEAVSSLPNTAGGNSMPAAQRNALHKPEIYIGIDCGVNTGVAIWNTATKKFIVVKTVPIHQAMDLVKYWHGVNRAFVRFEDARLRTWFGNSGPERWKGAGSVMRDSKIWEDWLRDMGIRFEAVAPKDNMTKLSAIQFNATTGWEGVTNEHGRDAAMLVYQM